MSVYSFDGRIPQISPHAYISPTAVIVGDVIVGPDCYIGPGAVLRGDSGRIEIDSGTAVEDNVVLHIAPEKTLSVGKRVTIGHGAIVHCARIADLAVIGMGATVSNDAIVGQGAIVAEGAVVVSNQEIDDEVMVAGTPAKIIRPIEDRDRTFWTWGKQHYVDLVGEYLAKGIKALSPSEYLTTE